MATLRVYSLARRGVTVNKLFKSELFWSLKGLQMASLFGKIRLQGCNVVPVGCGSCGTESVPNIANSLTCHTAEVLLTRYHRKFFEIHDCLFDASRLGRCQCPRFVLSKGVTACALPLASRSYGHAAKDCTVTAGLVARSQLLVSWFRMTDIAALNGVDNMQIGTASSFDMTAAALSCHRYRDVLPLHHTCLRYFHVLWLYHFSQVPSHSPVPRSWHCRPSQQICG